MEKSPQESWRPARNYGQKYLIKPNSYEISSLGNIRRTIDGKLLCLELGKYARVQLSTTNFNSGNRKSRSYPVHHLVYFAFNNDEIVPGLQVDHIDRNSLNNSVHNLRLCSAQENAANKIKKIPRPGSSREVEGFNFDGIKIGTFASAPDAARILSLKNRASSHIQECCVGLRRSAYGHIWKYSSVSDLDGEVWLPIKGCNKWQISNQGRARKGTNGKITIGSGANDIGYFRIKIHGKNILVHRLVIEHFGPPAPTLKHIVNHIDGNKINNCITNLEWLTQKENVIHARKLRASS